jgi:hypothetical protein
MNSDKNNGRVDSEKKRKTRGYADFGKVLQYVVSNRSLFEGKGNGRAKAMLKEDLGVDVTVFTLTALTKATGIVFADSRYKRPGGKVGYRSNRRLARVLLNLNDRLGLDFGKSYLSEEEKLLLRELTKSVKMADDSSERE